MTVTGVQLQVLLTAELPMPSGYTFRSSGSRLSQFRNVLRRNSPSVRSPCLAYVVRHPSAGVIVIDTGFHPDAQTNLRRDFGLAMSLFFRGIEVPAPFDVQLRSLDVDPREVQRVVMTHLHVDHTSGMRLLPQASFVTTRAEWDAAHTRLAAANGFVSHHLPPAARMEFLDYAVAGEPHEVFGHTIDLLGDGTVRLISTPGHTPGHQSVLLSLQDGSSALLVGDAAYTLRSIREQVLPLLTADDDAYRSTLSQLKEFSERHPDVIVVPTHDPEAWRQLPAE